jgi:hypothetical protein
MAGAQWREWTIDGTHSNSWHDAAKADLEQTGAGTVEGNALRLTRTLGANSVTAVELTPAAAATR